jgi:hypothetical protein
MKNPIDETKFITDIITKVQQNIKPDASPMESFSSILKSGVATELISGIKGGLQSGQLDMHKMISAVQGVVGNLQNQPDTDPDTKKAMGIINTLIGSMGTGNGGTPDLGSLMQSVMGMMSTTGDDSSDDESVSKTGGVVPKTGMPDMASMLSMIQTVTQTMGTVPSITQGVEQTPVVPNII